MILVDQHHRMFNLFALIVKENIIINQHFYIFLSDNFRLCYKFNQNVIFNALISAKIPIFKR